MSKIPKSAVETEIVESDIWDWEHVDLQETVLADLGREFDDGVNRTWRWYLKVETYKPRGWTHVVVSSDHKNITVANWLTDNGAEFEYEGSEFLIKQSDLATLAALRWA